jgi:hypothetical protein
MRALKKNFQLMVSFLCHLVGIDSFRMNEIRKKHLNQKEEELAILVKKEKGS